MTERHRRPGRAGGAPDAAQQTALAARGVVMEPARITRVIDRATVALADAGMSVHRSLLFGTWTVA